MALVVMAGAPAFGQTSTLSGVVRDSAGGVIPGADVVIKHNATGVTTSAVSNSEGAFSFPGVQTGVYTVTVTLQGFKTFVANNVTLATGTPAAVNAVLEVGGVTETVTVSSRSEIIQTQDSTVSSTVSMNQIQKLPMTSRSGLDFVNFLPGVSTPGGNRQASINGLPRGAINITLDGVNIQDNTLRSTDGFFTIVQARLDAIEEVTVTTASQGAGDTGQGAVQVKFVTRSGTNDYTGSAYTTYRSDKFNENTWFNIRNKVDKAKLTQHQPGARLGGPISIPGLFDGRNKAFFFVNYEEFHQPSDVTRNRTIFHPRAEQGIFRYDVGGGVAEVNLLQLAAANGQISTMDPTIAALLSAIRASTATTGSVEDNTNPLTQRYTFNVPVESVRRYPTVRLDYNVTDAHRLSSAWNYNKFTDYPDTLNSREAHFPGFPVAAGQSSIRQSWSNSLRSTLGGNFVNELRVGWSESPVTFFGELNKSLWDNQGGFQQSWPLVTGPSAAPSPQGRNAWNYMIEDSVSWLRGNHSVTFGGTFTHLQTTSYIGALVPTVTFDVLTGDPALGMFNAANFPGASTTQITSARQMYALLTGRLSSINGDARLVNGKYVYMGDAVQEGRMREAGFFVQDSWRWKPNFTVNAGLRYELQFPFYPLNNSYSTATLDSICGISGVNNRSNVEQACNIYQPGNLSGVRPEYVNFGEGEYAFKVDKNNWAPSIGFAWVLGERNGILGAILGDESVVRGGYSKSFSREGLTNFTGRFASNPGLNLFNEPDRSAGNGNLGPLPLLLSQKDRLGPGEFPEAPTYPMFGSINDSINRFDENIQVPWAESVSIGLQRALGRNHVIEARYVGTRARDTWTTYDYNQPALVENGFLDEFRLAQANLQANIAAGRGATFAYTGIPGTSPLPIYLAHFTGTPFSQAGDPSRYTGTLWSNANYVNPLTMWNPNPFAPAAVPNTNANIATSLYGTPALRANMAAAGLPANFWLTNPDKLGGAIVTGGGGKTHYNSMQLELRRRLHNGLQFNASYVLGGAYESARFGGGFRRPRVMLRDTGDPGDLTHAFKNTLVYDLPFGRGRRFASNAGPVMERILGGWSLGMNNRIQSGRLVDLGNVRLVGMTEDDVKKMYKLRIDENQRVYMFPQAIIDETIKAFSLSATSLNGYGSLGPPSGQYFAPANGPDCIEVAPGYGDCGTGSRLYVQGPWLHQHDIAISKRIALFGRSNLELRAEALNAFNQVNYIPTNPLANNANGLNSTPASLTNWELTGLTGTNTARVLQFIGRINF